MTNRRGFIASLLALPTAAIAVLCKSNPLQRQSTPPTDAAFREAIQESCGLLHRCFNCQRFTAPSKWTAAGADGLFAVTNRWVQFQYHHLCDDCIEAIQHCATCGVKLNGFSTENVEEWGKVGGLRLSPASEPMASSAWPKMPLGVITWAGMLARPMYGTRPVTRDLIVADCPNCAIVRKHWALLEYEVFSTHSGRLCPRASFTSSRSFELGDQLLLNGELATVTRVSQTYDTR